jgi:hypothetical protein
MLTAETTLIPAYSAQPTCEPNKDC